MHTALIAGANRGIGLEFVRQYAAEGWRVIAGCRVPGEARALKSIEGDVKVRPLDVTDHASVQDLASSLKRDSIDVLICNAGIYGPRPTTLSSVDYAAWSEVFRVNTMAPLKMAECFVDHVARSRRKVIVTVSSKMGSMEDNLSGGSYIYRSSKAALNAVTKSLSVDLLPRGVAVVAIHPGWVRTDMGGPSALIDVEESVSGMRRVIDRLTPDRSGRFLSFDDREISW